jgi:K+-transporting ATPase ATPase A chain
MAAQAFLLIVSFLLVLFILARPLGTLLAKMIVGAPSRRINAGERTAADDGD